MTSDARVHELFELGLYKDAAAALAKHVERALIQRALAACDGRVDDAARMLGLSRKGLYLKRQRLGLD